MRSLLASLTLRGRAFMAAGLAAAAFGWGIGQRDLISLGGLLVLLPLLTALAASRRRYQVRCSRRLAPARGPAGQPVTVTLNVSNSSRLATGLLLAEDSIPYVLGPRPRFVLERIEPGGSRALAYQIQSDHRGKFAIGPLQLQVADVFGLARLGTSVDVLATLVVTPAITTLPRAPLTGTWFGDGGTRSAITATAGEDDVVPRPYRQGDELRRVHWRSSARHGELMVRREEQNWRNRAVLFLDTRGAAHLGSGPASSFEYAVSATASIGVHLARQGIDGTLVTDTGTVAAPGAFEDVLLDALAVVRTSRQLTLAAGLPAMPREGGGLMIAVTGQLSAADARQLAASRRSGGLAMALLLDAPSWSEGQLVAGGTFAASQAASILADAGWRVAVAGRDTPIPDAWRNLCSSGSYPRYAGAGTAGGAGVEAS